MAASGGKRVPSFKVGALGDAGRDLRRRCAQEVTAFRDGYRDTRQRRLEGEDAAYPHGTYGPRVFYHAPVEPRPDPDALLALAGPTSLEEALGGAQPATLGEHRNLMLDAVREAQRHEALDMLEEEHLDFEPDARAPRRAPATGEREEAETRHRFASTREVADTEQHPRRLVTERDRRQGRPPGDTGPPR